VTNEPTIWPIALFDFSLPATPTRDRTLKPVSALAVPGIVLLNDVTHVVVHFDETLAAISTLVFGLVFYFSRHVCLKL
jgi:hypothetical protein